MLDDEARSAIGVPHPTGRAAMRMLEAEGFAAEGYVDIFDGGPTMTARTDRVESVKQAKKAVVSQADAETGERALIATGHLSSFRCCFGARAFLDDGTVAIDSQAADTLDVKPGNEVWSVAR